MRKTIQTLLLVVGGVVATQAQTIIPKVGLSLATTTASEFEEGVENSIGAQPGLSLGVGYTKTIASFGKTIFSLQPELLFLQKGFSVESKGEYYEGEAIYEFRADQKFKLNYIEVPVLAKLEFGAGKVRFFTYVGPSFSVGLGGKMKGEFTFDDGYYSFSEDFESDIIFGDAPADEGDLNEDVYLDNRFEVGAQVGIGATILNKVSVDVRYGLGFTDLSDDGDSANRVLQFTVGVPFGLK